MTSHDKAEKGLVHDCLTFLFEKANGPSSPTHDLPGAMAVSEELPEPVPPEFPPVGMTCPHGVHLWAYPNAERIAALRRLNEEGSRG